MQCVVISIYVRACAAVEYIIHESMNLILTTTQFELSKAGVYCFGFHGVIKIRILFW